MKPTLLIVPVLLGAALLWWLTWGTAPRAPRVPPAGSDELDAPAAIEPPSSKPPPTSDGAVDAVAAEDPASSGVLVLALMERQHAREQVRLLAVREKIHEQLFENGRVTETELLLARIDHAVVRATAADAAERKQVLDGMIQHTRRLSTVLELLRDAGRAPAPETETLQLALGALEDVRLWLDSELRWDGEDEPPLSPLAPPSGPLPTTREALWAEWERLAAEHLEQELALLAGLAPAGDEKHLDFRGWSLRMRRNLALTRLDRRDDLQLERLERAVESSGAGGDEAAAWRVVDGQMSLYTWYLSRALYETTCK